MEIKITKKESGLEVGKVYDLCDRAAKNLLGRRCAVSVEAEKAAKPAEAVKVVSKAKAKERKPNERNTK